MRPRPTSGVATMGAATPAALRAVRGKRILHDRRPTRRHPYESHEGLLSRSTEPGGPAWFPRGCVEVQNSS